MGRGRGEGREGTERGGEGRGRDPTPSRPLIHISGYAPDNTCSVATFHRTETIVETCYGSLCRRIILRPCAERQQEAHLWLRRAERVGDRRNVHLNCRPPNHPVECVDRQVMSARMRTALVMTRVSIRTNVHV